MIHDEELRSSLDYSAGQKEAAYRILIELVNLVCFATWFDHE